LRMRVEPPQDRTCAAAAIKGESAPAGETAPSVDRAPVE
jgi:hypothetical protein